MVDRGTRFLSCCLSSLLLLRRAQDGTQSLPDNNFLSGLDCHGNEFDVIGSFALLGVGTALAHSSYEAGIVCPQHFNDGVAGAKLAYAVCNGKAPSLLVPLHSQRWITISIIGYKSAGGHPWYGINQLADSVDASVPLLVKFLFVDLQP